jgi:hypothetical protein
MVNAAPHNDFNLTVQFPVLIIHVGHLCGPARQRRPFQPLTGEPIIQRIIFAAALAVALPSIACAQMATSAHNPAIKDPTVQTTLAPPPGEIRSRSIRLKPASRMPDIRMWVSS